MKLAFATLGCPNWDRKKIIKEAARMGYDGVELRGAVGEHLGPDESDAELSELRRDCGEANVEIASIMGYTNFASHVEETRRTGVEVSAKYIRVAQKIGCPVLRVFGGIFEDDLSDARTRVISCLKELAPAAEKANVKLCIETHDHWLRGEDLFPIIDAVGSPAVGVCWDVANSFFKEAPQKSWSSFGSHVHHVHFKDVKKTEEGEIAIMPGKGDVDHQEVLSVLHKGGYKGYISFEWEKKWQAHLEEPEVAFPQFEEYIRGMIAKLK